MLCTPVLIQFDIFKQGAKGCCQLFAFGDFDILKLVFFFRYFLECFHAEADLSIFVLDDFDVYLIAYR